MEQNLGIGQWDQLHIQMMNAKWGSGDPNQALTDLWFAAYDDHRYLKWDGSVAVSKDNYISTSCNDDRGGNWPTIVGEFSLSPPDNVQWTADWAPDTNKDFYKKWFAAQVMAYEKQDGWIFWTWKSQLGDYRWSYQGESSTTIDKSFHLGRCPLRAVTDVGGKFQTPLPPA